ncbi:MAG: elongation factor P maturation arginine rhamnosyltransferase EarP [Burkholderiaceae bacterium]|nr:elongation factor P maturation arginine rhamnosyltransferase EarP [Burkholderiaceae bacterium]
MPLKTLHLYCHVVDNFGDAGVCWRLARQLAREHALEVTLWIDRPEVLRRLVPDLVLDVVQDSRFAQAEQGIAREAALAVVEPIARPVAGGTLAVRPWPLTEPIGALADAVVCAFGCEPPAWLRNRLAGGPSRPLWLNLEYLSAEDWVDGCHRLASIKPADGACEYFYFPGYRPTTGGLLRERTLLTERDAFHCGTVASTWWRAHDLPEQPGRRVSIFCYPDAPLPALLRAMADGPESTIALLPEGVGGAALQGLLDELGAPAPGHRVPRWQFGRLILARLPMLPIDDYDRLLWSCEMNFVRGEDSWLRGLWAGRPMVWQPYRQADEAHRAKLDAFLHWQTQALRGLAPATAPRNALTALADLSHAWSAGTDPGAAWASVAAALPELTAASAALSREMALQRDLADLLVEFCNSKL